MPRTSRKQIFKCENHMLTLQPLKNNLYFAEKISCCFCSEKKSTTKARNSKKQSDNCLTCPIFNKDYNHGSPSFILSSEKVYQKNIKNYFSENGFRLQVEHDKKIQHYTDSKSQMCIPKPRSKHNYCSVCRRNYDDYLQHILSSSHKREIGRSKFNKYILDVAKKIKSSNQNEQIISSDSNSQKDVQIIQGPKKRIKPNPQFQSLPINQVPRFPYYGAMPLMPPLPPVNNIHNFAFDLHLLQQRQMFNVGLNPYCYVPPHYGCPPISSFPYHLMPFPMGPSYGPIRANYVYINQNA